MATASTIVTQVQEDGARPEPAELARALHVRDAVGDREQDHGRDQHLQKPDEELPDVLHRVGGLGRQHASRDGAPERDAEQRADQDLPVQRQTRVERQNTRNAVANRVHASSGRAAASAAADAARAAAIPIPAFEPRQSRGSIPPAMKYTAPMDAQRFRKLADELAERDPGLTARLRQRARSGARAARRRLRRGRGLPRSARRSSAPAISRTSRSRRWSRTRSTSTRCSSGSRAGASKLLCVAIARGAGQGAGRRPVQARQGRGPVRRGARCAAPRSSPCSRSGSTALVREATVV